MVGNHESKKGGAIDMSVTRVAVDFEGKTTDLENQSNDIYCGDIDSPKETGIYPLTISAYSGGGNVTSKTINVRAELWSKPKVNWQPTDRFNIVDYNRIKNNLAYLYQLAITLWNEFDMPDMGENITEYTEFWDVGVFNLFESNLELINQNIFTQDFGVSQRFFENGAFIKWDELNRIESATLSMKNLLQSQKDNLKKLSFKFGRFKEVKI